MSTPSCAASESPSPGCRSDSCIASQAGDGEGAGEERKLESAEEEYSYSPSVYKQPEFSRSGGRRQDVDSGFLLFRLGLVDALGQICSYRLSSTCASCYTLILPAFVLSHAMAESAGSTRLTALSRLSPDASLTPRVPTETGALEERSFDQLAEGEVRSISRLEICGRPNQRQPGFEGPALPAVHSRVHCLSKDQVLDLASCNPSKGDRVCERPAGVKLSVHERVRSRIPAILATILSANARHKSRPKHVTSDSAQTRHLEDLASHSELAWECSSLRNLAAKHALLCPWAAQCSQALTRQKG